MVGPRPAAGEAFVRTKEQQEAENEAAAAAAGQSAATRVFNITELLEKILLEALVYEPVKIDTTDATIREARAKLSAIGKANACIFASQRVNKRFLHTIQGSQQLMQALWMLPEKPPPCYTTPASRLGCVNPMFIKASTRTPRTPTWRQKPGLFLDFYPDSADDHPNDFCMSLQDFSKLKGEGMESWRKMLLFNSCMPWEQVCGFAVAWKEDFADFWVSFSVPS